MRKKGLSIVNLIIIFLYVFVISIPIVFVLSFLGAQPWWSPMILFLRTTCFGGVIFSFLMYTWALFLTIISKPLCSIMFGPNERLYQKLKKFAPIVGGIVGFSQTGMYSCRIWYILGVEGHLQIIYTVIIFLCIIFLGAFYVLYEP